MRYIGIDFSINYPGVCIANQDFTQFKWIACINDNGITKKFKTLLQDAELKYHNLKFIFVDGKQKKTETYHLTERNKLTNQIAVVTALSNAIQNEVRDDFSVIGIEGLSFGSAGNSLLDLAHATGILKTHLYHSSFSRSESFFIFSPSELKKAVGAKGNANKIEIFNTFLTDPKIPELRTSDLFKFIVENKDEIFNGKVIKSPIMDMVDSTLSVIHLHNMHKN